jgi:hypothetical protein
MKIKHIASISIISIIFAGCGGAGISPDNSSGGVSYKNTQDVEQTTLNFGSTDLKLIAEKMVNSLLSTPILDGSKRPVVMLSKVKNKTSEHIDTKSITDKIKSSLLKSGRVRVTSYNEIGQELQSELDYQSSKYVNQKSAKKIGEQIGADYKIYGEITSITKVNGNTTDVYYKMTLNLANIENGLIEWADEKEIRKVGEKALFSY